jgi:hypothetical protein
MKLSRRISNPLFKRSIPRRGCCLLVVYLRKIKSTQELPNNIAINMDVLNTYVRTDAPFGTIVLECRACAFQNTRGSRWCTCVPFSNQKVVTQHYSTCVHAMVHVPMVRTYKWYHGTTGTHCTYSTVPSSMLTTPTSFPPPVGLVCLSLCGTNRLPSAVVNRKPSTASPVPASWTYVYRRKTCPVLYGGIERFASVIIALLLLLHGRCHRCMALSSAGSRWETL